MLWEKPVHEGEGSMREVHASGESGEEPRLERNPFFELRRWRLSPMMLFALMLFSIFSAEVLVMIVLGFFPRISRFTLPLLDAFLLSVLVFPLLYLLFFRPITEYVRQCREQWRQKERLLEELKRSRDALRS
jgi:hypothetical protein